MCSGSFPTARSRASVVPHPYHATARRERESVSPTPWGAPVGMNATTTASQPAHRGTTTRPRPRVFPATKTAQAVFDRRRASPPLTKSTRYALSRGVQLQTAAGTSGSEQSYGAQMLVASSSNKPPSGRFHGPGLRGHALDRHERVPIGDRLEIGGSARRTRAGAPARSGASVCDVRFASVAVRRVEIRIVVNLAGATDAQPRSALPRLCRS